VVSNSPTGGTIFKFTPSGTRSTFASGLGQGFGLAFNNAGNLFAVDAVNQTIFEYTPGGTRTTFVGPAAFGPNESPSGQLAFDSAGNVFVSTLTSDFTMGSILEFTPGGTESTFATGLRSPRGVAFDSTGNLFVTENIPGIGDILEFTPGGIETVFASGISNPQFLTFGPARVPAGPNLPDSGSTFAIFSIALAALESARRRFAATTRPLLRAWTEEREHAAAGRRKLRVYRK
jgi:VPDSG-CTERM motif